LASMENAQDVTCKTSATTSGNLFLAITGPEQELSFGEAILLK
jgi:hypothetical protein